MTRVVRASALLLLTIALPLTAQEPRGGSASSSSKARTPLTEADYAKFEVLGASALSPDGKWVAYEFRHGAGFGASELRYRPVAGDPEHSVMNGSGAAFSSNSRWLVYTIGIDSSAGRGARGGGRGNASSSAASGSKNNKVGIVDLRNGATTVLPDVRSFSISRDGQHVALRRYPPTTLGRQSRGSDLVVRDMEQGTDVSFGNVADIAWSDDGALLAMTIDVEGKTGNAVQLLNVSTGTLRSLDAGDALYAAPVWRAHSDDLAAFRSRADSAFADTSYTVLTWRGLATQRPTKQAYEFADDNAFPKGMRVASYRAPQWSDDGSVVFFGIAPREPKAPVALAGGGSSDAAQPARVEVWHWKDLREYHQQDRQAPQDRQKTHLVAWHLGQSGIARLADDSLDTVQLSDDRTVAIAADEAPYFNEIISGRSYRDIYRIDIATGKRTKVISKAPFGATISPAGRYLLYTQGGHWWTYDLETGARSNLTSKVKSVFVNMEDDHPVEERRGYGAGGWTTGDQSVLLYDRYDVWQVAPDGATATRLTRGREDSTVYRVEALDPDVHAIDPAKPILLSATGDWNRKSGFARLTVGQPAQRLVWLDKSVGRIIKAKDAEVYGYVVQASDDSPDLFVGTAALSDAKQISHTNAFLSDFAWGKQDLMTYTNGRGEKLQMMLTYPAGYKPGTKYPMVVYYYEKLSQGFHQFTVPSERATYNTTVFSQNGYFVLRPDIVFRPRDAGFSGLDCVTSAVKAALATGMIDAKRVGNMGHSWGGYQSAFYAVHNKGVFAATIAGAPLTNFISMYGYTSFNTGFAETGHFETGQERMQVSLWQDIPAYIRNSTVFAVDSLQTPLLLEEGDADGNVNPWQSMELYNFGRRLGKQVVYLLYNDENHGVARPESQMDYHRRQLEWFAHYLKGEPAADWITNGESYLKRQKLLKEAAGRGAAGVAETPSAPPARVGSGRGSP